MYIRTLRMFMYLERTGIIKNSLPGLSLVIADLVRRLISFRRTHGGALWVRYRFDFLSKGNVIVSQRDESRSKWVVLDVFLHLVILSLSLSQRLWKITIIGNRNRGVPSSLSPLLKSVDSTSSPLIRAAGIAKGHFNARMPLRFHCRGRNYELDPPLWSWITNARVTTSFLKTGTPRWSCSFSFLLFSFSDRFRKLLLLRFQTRSRGWNYRANRRLRLWRLP